MKKYTKLLLVTATIGILVALGGGYGISGAASDSCTVDENLITLATTRHETRVTNGNPNNDWGRWLEAVGVEIDNSVEPFTVAEAQARIKVWKGWEEYADALGEYIACLGRTSPPVEAPINTGGGTVAPSVGDELAPVYPSWGSAACTIGGTGKINDASFIRYRGSVEEGVKYVKNYGGLFSAGIPSLSHPTGSDSTTGKLNPVANYNEPGVCLMAGIHARMTFDSRCTNGEKCVQDLDRYRRAILFLIGLPKYSEGGGVVLTPLTVAEARSYATNVKVRLTNWTEWHWWEPIAFQMEMIEEARAIPDFNITVKVTETVYKGYYRSYRTYNTGDVVGDYGRYYEALINGPKIRPVYITAIDAGHWKQISKPAGWNARKIKISYNGPSDTIITLTAANALVAIGDGGTTHTVTASPGTSFSIDARCGFGHANSTYGNLSVRYGGLQTPAIDFKLWSNPQVCW